MREITVLLQIDDEENEDVCDELLLEGLGLNDLDFILGYEISKKENEK